MDPDQDPTQNNDIARVLGEMTSQYTTGEAKQLARTTYNDLYKERGEISAQEQEQLTKLDATASDAKEALKAARQRLLTQRWNESEKWYGLAAALGKPTKSGSFGESASNAAGSLQQSTKSRRDWQDNQALAILKNQLDSGEIDVNLAKARLDAIKARRTADDKMMTESMKVLGREVRTGTGGGATMSPYGKIALDEGLQKGTPEYERRVTQLYDQDMAQKRGAAGLDVQEVSPEETQLMASNMGVPVSPINPFRGLSTKAQQVAVEQSMKQGQTQLAGLADQDTIARSAIRQINRFEALNEKQKSGRLYGIPGINWITGFSDAAQEMDAITADIARHQRQPGEGTVSNYDATQFLIASPGRGKGYQVNKNIATAIRTAKTLQLEQSEFLSNYLAVNRHLQGAKEAWNRYLEANPIFDPKEKEGSFTLNKDRQDYKSFFRKSGPAAPAEDDPQASVPDNPSDAVDAELAAMTPEQREWATRPAKARGGKVGYAKGGKVGAFKNILEDFMKSINPDSNAAYQKVMPHPSAPRIVDPALVRLNQQKQLMFDGMPRTAMTPQELSQVEGVGHVFDTIVSNPKPDAQAGLRAEQMMRQLSDLLSKYRTAAPPAAVAPPLLKAEGGKVDKEAKERGYAKFMEDLARQVAQGGTYNFSDELLSGGDPEALRKERAALESFSGTDPAKAIAAQMAGAVPTGMVAGAAGHGLMTAMKGSGPTFHPKLGVKGGRAAAVANLLERVLPKSAIGKMAVSGATSGAVAGAGASQDNRGIDALEQGALGSLFGPAAGLTAKFTLGAGRRLFDWTRGTTPSGADEKLLAAIAKDKMDIDKIPSRLAADQKMGVPTHLGDIPGQNTAALVEAVAGKQGEGPAALADKIAGRQAQQGERIGDAVNKGLAPSEYYGELTKLKDALYTNADPLYQSAYKASTPVPVEDVSFLYDTKEGKAALKEAVNLMRGYGIQIGKKDITGSVRKLSVQSLDYTKRALDDMITKEEGVGEHYVATNRGRMLRAVRNKLRDTLDNHSPDYKAARAQYAGDLEVLDALRMGKEQFPKMSPKQLQAEVANMSYAERDALRTGVAEHLFDQIGKAPRGSNVATKVVGNPAMSEKLAAVFESPKEAAKFNEALLKEYNLFKQSGPVMANATRARAKSAAEGLDETPLANAADMALDVGQQAVFLPGLGQNTGGPWTTARIMQWVRNRMPMSEKTANEMSDMLGTSDPKKAREVVTRLKEEGERLGKRKALSDAVMRASGRAGAVATAPDPWAQQEGDQP